MMKRFLMILVVLCAIANTALGESIARRVDAPEVVSLPALSPNGIQSSFAFEAQVIVPDVEKVPILQVKIDEITEERIFAAADALGLTDINRKPSAWDNDIFKNGGKSKAYEGSSGWSQYYAYIDRYCEEEPDAITSAKLYRNELRKAEYFLGGMGATPYPDAPRDGTLTRDGAYALAQKTIDAFTQGYLYTLEKDGALGGSAQLSDAEIAALKSGRKDTASISPVPYAFAFYFAPVFEGISLTQTDRTGRWSSREDVDSLASIGYASSVAVQSQLQVVLLDEGVHALEWRDPLSVIGMLQEDSRLLPFEDILEKGTEALKEFCEREDERIADDEGLSWEFVVTEIRFGYLCRQMEPDSMDLRLVPVWDFMVRENWVRDGQTGPMYENYGHAIVTLSAEDGSILYREDTEMAPMNKGVER